MLKYNRLPVAVAPILLLLSIMSVVGAQDSPVASSAELYQRGMERKNVQAAELHMQSLNAFLKEPLARIIPVPDRVYYQLACLVALKGGTGK
jgi:hypothetical protein